MKYGLLISISRSQCEGLNIPLYRQRPLPTPPIYYLPPSKFDTSFLFFRQHRLDEIRDKYKYKLMKEQNKITCFYKQHQADSKLQQSQVSIGVKRNINKHK